jgi:hypothetical protein
MDDDATAREALLRRGAHGARKTGKTKKNGVMSAPVDADDAHEQAPLLWRGERGSDDEDGEDDVGEAGQNGREEQAVGGADDSFDEWEGLPWYKKPSVSVLD